MALMKDLSRRARTGTFMKTSHVLLGLLLLSGCSERPADPGKLVEALSGSEIVAAFSVLESSQEAGIVPAIVEGTHHPNARVRAQCAKLLARRRDVTGIEPLKKMLGDSDLLARGQAARSLVTLLENEPVKELIARTDLSWQARHALIQAFLRLGPESLLEPECLDWLDGPSWPLPARIANIKALRARYTPASRELPEGTARVQTMIDRAHRIARNESNDVEWRAAAWGLYARLSGPVCFEELVGVRAATPHRRLQESLTVALGLSAHPEALPRLAAIARDRKQFSSVRCAALQGLAELASYDASDVILEALQDPDVNVRRGAVRSLCCERAREPYKVLAAARAQETDADVECALASALRCAPRGK